MLTSSDGGIVYSYGVSNIGTEFAYNILYSSYGDGRHVRCDGGSGWEWRIHHNVFWNRNGETGKCIGSTMKKNLVYNNTMIDSEGDEEYYNQLICNGNPDSVGIIDYENFDFSLKSTSPAINKGVTEFVITPQDDSGNYYRDGKPHTFSVPYEMPDTLYADGKPDLGAFEYGTKPWTAGHDWGEPSWEYPLKEGVAAMPAAHISKIMPLSVRVCRNYLAVTGAQWSCKIIDSKGRRILAAKNSAIKSKTAYIDTRNLASGMYIAKIASESNLKTVPFVKTR
jgi:hypothetical protein